MIGIAAVPLIGGLWRALGEISTGDVLVDLLEQRFQRTIIGDPATVTGVIALGGGEQRLREACRLALLHPHLKVFVSGAGNEAKVRAELGPALRNCPLALEDQSTNTRTNAAFTGAVLKPAASERWLLVTSAFHMPRAIGAFRKSGITLEPWPVYDRADKSRLPAAAVRHEWLGLAAYWALGHSSELFPAPHTRAPAAMRQANAYQPRT